MAKKSYALTSRGKAKRKIVSPRHPDQTRATILEAAFIEFADKGLAGARVDEIARRTATSKHMIYYYFGNKEGLYRAVLAYVYQNVRFAEQKIDYTKLAPIEALTSLVGLSFDFHVNSPQYVRVIMGENMNNGEHIHHITDFEQRRTILDSMSEIVSRGIKGGDFRRNIDVLQLHMTITALCFYYVANRFSFGHIFQVNLEAPSMLALRRKHVIDAALSICLPRGA